MPLPDAVKLIRGPEGTRVRLTLIPASSIDESERKPITLAHDEDKLEAQQTKARIVNSAQKSGSRLRLGLIDLPRRESRVLPGSLPSQCSAAAASPYPGSCSHQGESRCLRVVPEWPTSAFGGDSFRSSPDSQAA